MTVQRMGMGSGVEGARSSFAPGWRGWLLLVAVSGALCLSPVPAAATMIDGDDTIEAISATAIDTTYDYDYNGGDPIGLLTMEQSGVALVLAGSGIPQETFPDVYFKFTTTLSSENSDSGQAIGIFTGGEIIIRDGSATGDLLLKVDINSFHVEEVPDMPWSLLTGSGGFNNATGSLVDNFATSGNIIDITWQLDRNIKDFKTDFNASSNVTLLPEPATTSLLVMGGIAMLIRRKRRRGV